MTAIGGFDLDMWMTKMSAMITGAPEELRFVLSQIKMSKSKSDGMKALSSSTINAEMLGKTLAYLQNTQENDESITRLLKEGKKEMIIREVVNFMPLNCVTCNKDSQFQPGDRPQVRCRRCCRGACIECFPEPKNGWVYLCKICDKDVQKLQVIPETSANGNSLF